MCKTSTPSRSVRHIVLVVLLLGTASAVARPCPASCPEKQTLFLVHAVSCLKDLSQFPVESVEVVQLVRKDEERDCPNAVNEIAERAQQLSRADARNQLYAEALKLRCFKCYLYVVMVDADFGLEAAPDKSETRNPWTLFLETLFAWEPAVAQPARGQDANAQLEVETPLQINQAIIALHREATGFLLPYSVRRGIDAEDAEALFESMASAVYRGHVLQVNRVALKARSSADYFAATPSPWLTRFAAEALRRLDDFLNLQALQAACGREDPEAPKRRAAGNLNQYVVLGIQGVLDPCHEQIVGQCDDVEVQKLSEFGCWGHLHTDCTPSPLRFQEKLLLFLQELHVALQVLEGERDGYVSAQCEAHAHPRQLQISHPDSSGIVLRSDGIRFHGLVAGLPNANATVCDGFGIRLQLPDGSGRFTFLAPSRRLPVEWYCPPRGVVGVREFKANFAPAHIHPGIHTFRVAARWCENASLQERRCVGPAADAEGQPSTCNDVEGLASEAWTRFRVVEGESESDMEAETTSGHDSSAAPSPELQFVYLVQSDTCLDLAHLASPRSRVIQLNWKRPPTPACPDHDVLYLPNSTLVQGRNRLFEEVETRYAGYPYRYVVLMDGDVTLVEVADFGANTGNAWRTFEEYLLHWEPAVGFPHFGGMDYDPEREVQLAYNFDQIVVAYHRDTLPLLLPYTEAFDHLSWWYCGAVQNALVTAAYNDHRLQFNALRALSWSSNVSPVYKRGSNFHHPLAWIAPAIRSFDSLMLIPFNSPHQQATASVWDSEAKAWTTAGQPKRKGLRSYALDSMSRAVFDFCHEYFQDRRLYDLCDVQGQSERTVEDAVLRHLTEVKRRVEAFHSLQGLRVELQHKARALRRRVERFECAVHTMQSTGGAPAAGVATSASTEAHPTAAADSGNFEQYVKVVCDKCALRGMDCGCDLGPANPPFKVLREYAAKYEGWRQELQACGVGCEGVSFNWVVVPASGGLGNQLLQMVNGLLFAIATGRAFALQQGERIAGQQHDFTFDSVLQFMQNNQNPLTLRWLNFDTLDQILCGNWELELEGEDIGMLLGQPPALFLANPLYGPVARDSFHGIPFFFLSHFIWLGERSRQAPVQVRSLPVPLQWDGRQQLGGFLGRLRSSRPLLAIGVHVRIAGHNRDFAHFDHRLVTEHDVGVGEEKWHSAFCAGHPASMGDVHSCISSLVQSALAEAPSRPAGSAAWPDIEGSVVVLWSCDRDDLSEDLLDHLSSLRGVHVVRLVHEDDGFRHDAWPDTGLLDMTLLEAAHAFVGSTGSTFSFAAHARGLIRPYYPSFRAHRAPACGTLANSEAGLLFNGAFHDECMQEADGGYRCNALRQDCLTTVSAGIELGSSCLQDWAQCLMGDNGWAGDYVVDLDHAYFGMQYLMRVSEFTRFVSASGDRLQGCHKNFEPAATRSTAASAWTRFALYRKTVCAKCERRSIDCGCSQGLANPPFQHLQTFLERMLAHQHGASPKLVKWIVVRLSGGVGNQMMQLVTGMMMAMATGRALALKKDADHVFQMDAVIEPPSYDQLSSLGLSECAPLEVAEGTLELLMCGNLERELETCELVEICFGQPPQLLLANPLHGGLFLEGFLGKPYFFLSHFFFIGSEVLQWSVTVRSAPSKAVWDAARNLGELAHMMQIAKPCRVIGVHARVHSEVPFENFDQRVFAVAESEQGPDLQWDAESFCQGDRRSLNEAAECVHELVREAVSAQAEGDGTVAVLWATDNEALASGLRDALQSSGVLLVELVHPELERSGDLRSALLDLAFLELADVVIGTLASTFSYAVHARSLSIPFYPAFRMDRSSNCGRSLASEAGMIAKATTHEGCEGRPGRIECARLREQCLQLIMWDGTPGMCLQDVARCLLDDTRWAEPYIADADHAVYAAQFNARHGRTLYNPDFPTAPPDCREGSRTVDNASTQDQESSPAQENDADLYFSSSGGPDWKAHFSQFAQLVCEKCRRRAIDCGCGDGDSNPAFTALWEYCTLYQGWVQQQRRGARLKWVLVPAMGGHSNQLLQLVNGLLLAMATGRALAVDWDGRDTGEENHKYAFDGVLEWMSKESIGEEALARRRIVGWKKEGVEDVLCGDWEWEWEHLDVVQICLSQPPQLLLANSLFGSGLNETFRGLPFFFLSHFFWTGNVERATRVQIETLPSAAPWDGEQELGDFVRRLRLSMPGLVVGVHARIDGFGKEFVFFDHAELRESSGPGDVRAGERWRHTFCHGDEGSLKELSSCVGALVEEHGRGECEKTGRGEGDGGGDRSGMCGPEKVVVLWAADRDDLTKLLLRRVASTEGVQVVHVVYEQVRRYDSLPWAALVDMVLLEEAEVLVGSIGSTFSYAAQARGLANGFYPAFRQDRGSACGIATGTEGGLLVRTATHDGCSIDHGSRKIVCSRLRESCLSAIQAGVEVEACIQDLAPCLDGNTAWADSALVDAKHLEFSAQYWARHGYEMIVNGTLQAPICDPRTRKDFRADETAPIRRAFESFKKTVCEKCRRRAIDCGCGDGDSNPAFTALWEYCTLYQGWVQQQRRGARLKWVLVPAMGGHSNQLLQLVNGLLLAMATGRALAVDWDGRDTGEENHKYAFDGVLEWMSKESIGEEALARRRIVGWKKEGVEDVLCGDWEWEWEHLDVVQICLSQPPQLLLANSLFGSGLNETFRGLPFFFLSHFFWTGNVERATRVQIETLPSAAPWDGEQELGDFVRRLRSKGTAQVVGVHAHVDSCGEKLSRDNEQDREDDDGTRCHGGSRGIQRAWADVMRLVAARREEEAEESSGDTGGKRGWVVVLWATDGDEESEQQLGLQQEHSQAGVSWVRVLHGKDRRNMLPWSPLVDAALLEEAAVLLAVPDDASFVTHARGLVSPLVELKAASEVLRRGSDWLETNCAHSASLGGNAVGAAQAEVVKEDLVAGCAPIATDTHAGTWISDPDFCAREPQFHTCLPGSNLRWQPKDEHCDLLFHDATSACEMLAANGMSKILIAGDSIMRNIFTAFSLLLTGDYEHGAYTQRTHPENCAGAGQFFSDCKSHITSYDGDKPEKFGWATRMFCDGALNVSMIDNCLAVPSQLDMSQYNLTLWGIGLHNADRWKRLPRFDQMDPNLYSIWIRSVAAAQNCVWLPEWDPCVAHGPTHSDVCVFTSWVIGVRGHWWNQTCSTPGFDQTSFSDLVWIPPHIPPAEWLLDYPYEFRNFASESWQWLTQWDPARVHYFDNIGITAGTPLDLQISAGTHGVHYGAAVNLVKANLLLDLVHKKYGGWKQTNDQHPRAIDTESGNLGVSGHVRFDAYMRIVCSKCKAKQQDCQACGGELTTLQAPFSVLFAYTERYDKWRADYAMEKPVSRQWVIADISSQQSLHHQMAEAISPLLVALLLERPLALNSDATQPERFHLYRFFKSVVSWFDFSDVRLLGLPRNEDSLVLSADETSVRALSCTTIDELRHYDLIRFTQAVHPQALYLNPQMRSWLASTFGSTPSFWLSHFIQSGARLLDAPVLVKAVPADDHWVGRHRLRDVIRNVTELSKTSTVVSVHIDSHALSSGALPVNRGDKCAAIRGCLQHVLAEALTGQQSFLVLLGGLEGDSRRREQLAACVATLAEGPVVFVEREYGRDRTKPERSAHFDLIEAEMLAQGTRIIASPSSLAYILIHSRAQLAPRFLKFDLPDACSPTDSGSVLLRPERPKGACDLPRLSLLGAERPLLVLVLSPAHVGSTMLLNLVRLLMESQYPAVGNFAHLPGDENEVLEYLDTLKTPAVVKTHSSNINWWMHTKRRDGSPLVDAIFTATRHPADALCSFFATQERTAFPEDWDAFTMLGEMLWMDQFVIKSQAQPALALSLNIDEIKSWPRALKLIAMALGLEVAPAVLENIQDRMALLHTPLLSEDAHPITRLQPNHVSDYAAASLERYEKQCAEQMQAVLEDILSDEGSGNTARLMADVGTFPPVSGAWMRGWFWQRGRLGVCGSEFGAEGICRLPFLTLPIRLLDTVSSSLVVRCRAHPYLRSLRCSQETATSLGSGPRAEKRSASKQSPDRAERPETMTEASSPLDSRMGGRSAEIFNHLLNHHCRPTRARDLSSRAVVVDLNCGDAGAVLQALAAGCNVLCFAAEPPQAWAVASNAVHTEQEGAVVVVEAGAGRGLEMVEGSGEELGWDPPAFPSEEGESQIDQRTDRGRRMRRLRGESLLDGAVALVTHGSSPAPGAAEGLAAWLEAFAFTDWVGGREHSEWDRVMQGCHGTGRLYHWSESAELPGGGGDTVVQGAGAGFPSWLAEARFDGEALQRLASTRDHLWVRCEPPV